MNGRIESYIHSDRITENKSGILVKIECDTDFAAKTLRFKDFALRATKFAFYTDSENWEDVIKAYPDIEENRLALSKELKEKIVISEIKILKL